MLQFLTPQNQEIVKCNEHVLIWIKSGTGLIEVDFKVYSDLEDKLIFLSPEQYVKFIYGDFQVGKLTFPNATISRSKEFRVLFQHLISLGYVKFTEERQDIFDHLFSSDFLDILDISTSQWFHQNPFQAEPGEYEAIFDLKESIDEHISEHLSIKELVGYVDHTPRHLEATVKRRLGMPVKELMNNALLLKSQRTIASTDQPIQEVAYEMGFKDPAYFNRFFKSRSNSTPSRFRENFKLYATDSFLRDLLYLIKTHHRTEHSPSFYADRIHLSPKALSRKVRQRSGCTVGDLIRKELLNSARILLEQGTVKEAAFELGFAEANHFSTFFKHYTGESPSAYQVKMYKN